MILDIADPDIRQMVFREHKPIEARAQDGTLTRVQCRFCAEAWPCAAIQVARKGSQLADPSGN